MQCRKFCGALIHPCGSAAQPAGKVAHRVVHDLRHEKVRHKAGSLVGDAGQMHVRAVVTKRIGTVATVLSLPSKKILTTVDIRPKKLLVRSRAGVAAARE